METEQCDAAWQGSRLLGAEDGKEKAYTVLPTREARARGLATVMRSS